MGRRDHGRVRTGPSAIHGTGVFAVRDLGPGEVLLEIDDSRVVDADHPLLPGERADHCDYLAGGRVVLMPVPERYVNHCCDPNARMQWVGGGRRLVARRHIREGEEVTCDYSIDSAGSTLWECACGAPSCRRLVSADFFALPEAKLREYLPLLSPWFVAEHRGRVEQLARDLGVVVG